MNPSPWHLENHLAQLRISPLSACLDLLRPAAGLADWHGLGGISSAIRILAVEAPRISPLVPRPSSPVPHPSPLAEAYLRGPDLIAVYRESSDWPVALHALWRVLTAEGRLSKASSEDPARFVAALEVTLSVWTERLETQPGLCVCGRFPAGDALFLSDPGTARFEPGKPFGPPPTATGSAEGPGCVLFRPRPGDWSYAEMVHPADFGGSELLQDDAAGGQLVLRHRLFARRLEKGVLLRTRARGVFLQRENDTVVAAAQYRAFASAEPPLGA